MKYIINIYLTLFVCLLLSFNGFSQQDQYEPNNNFDSATTLEFDKLIRGNILNTGDRDYYKIEVTQSGVLTALLQNIPANLFYRVTIYDSNQQEIGSGGGNETDPAYADKLVCQPGTYYILINESGDNDASASEYELTVSFDIQDVNECNNSFDTATPITFDASISGAIFDVGDRDYYKIDVAQPGVLSTLLKNIPEDQFYRVTLFNSNKQEIANGSGSETNPAYADKLVCDAGTYYILINESGDNAASAKLYDLTVSFDIQDRFECNNNFDVATLIAFDIPVVGSIFDVGDRDYYQIEVTTPGVMSVILKDIPSGLFYRATVFDTDQREIIGGGGSETDPILINTTICTPGIYYVLINESGDNDASQDLYEFKIGFNGEDVYECNNTIGSAVAINPCTIIKGSIFPARDEDFYAINISQAGTYRLLVQDVPSDINLEVIISDEFGNRIERCVGNNFGLSINCEFSIPASGEYFIEISATGATQFNEDLYKLTFSNEVPCSAVPEICNNGVDDDGDGLIDCADSDCSEFVDCQGGGNNDCANVVVNLTAVNLNAETCAKNDGSITVEPNGGTAPYNFVWSSNAITLSAATLNNLSADTYSLTVTDATGCSSMGTFVINDECTNVPEICDNGIDDDGDGLIDCDDSDCSESTACQSDSCDDFSAGIATAPIDGCLRSFKAVPSGGTPPYSFLWRDGQTTDSIAYDISVNPNYAYTVTDSEGCTFTVESVATCTPTNAPTENDCTEADLAFLAGNWTGTFTGMNEEQSSMIVEIIIIDSTSFWGVMAIPGISPDPRFLFGTCSGDSIQWSGFDDLDNIELEGLYISPGGRYTETSINGDYYNTDSNTLEGTFALERTCSYPLARFTPIIKANGTVTFQNESYNNPTARFWEFGDGGEAIDVSPTHTYTQNGEYEVTLVVANDCREDTLSQMITINNIDSGTPPPKGDLLLYAGEVEGNVSEQVLLPIIIEKLDTITVLEGQIILDNPAIGQIIGTQAGAIDVGTINPDNLRIGFFATNGVGIVLNPKDTLFYLVIELTGSPNDMSTVTLPDFDVYGSFDSNNFTAIPYDTQNGKITIIGNFNITGKVQTYNNRSVEQTTVDLQIILPDGSQDAQTTTTLNDGSYSFQDVPAGSTCVIKPKKNTAIKNGVSTAALFLGQRYILGLDPPQINSPFQLFAGDANCDDRFSTVDLFLIQKVLVEIDDSFADCEGTWDFTPEIERANFRLNMDYHSNGTAPNDLTVTPTGDIVADFIGVKKGDILNLADPSNLFNEVLESRSNQTLPLEVRQIVQEETVEIAFYPSQAAALASYQLAFDLDEKEVAFQQLIGGTTLPISNITADGQLLVSWFTPNGEDVALNTAQPIFSLQFDKKELDFSQIALSEQRLEAIGFTTNLDKWKIQLIRPESTPTVFKVYQNTPNPFRQHTVIRFDLPQATPVQLHISNSLGQLVHQQQANYEAGQHQIAIADLNLAKGWYLYTVATNKHQATKKMLIIE